MIDGWMMYDGYNVCVTKWHQERKNISPQEPEDPAPTCDTRLFCKETFLDVSPAGSVLAWKTSFHWKCLISEDVPPVASALAWMDDGWTDG